MTETVYTGTIGPNLFDASGETAANIAVFRSIGAGDSVIGGAGSDRIALTGAGAAVNLGSGDDLFLITLDTRVIDSKGVTISRARDTIDGGTGNDLLNITVSSSQLTAEVMTEVARLKQYLAGDISQRFVSDILRIDMVNVERANIRLDGAVKALAEVAPNEVPSLSALTASVGATSGGKSPVTLSVKASDVDAASLTASISWGDGSMAGTVVLANAGGGVFTGSASHDYVAGSYTMQALVNDGTATSTATTLAIQIGSATPSSSVTLISRAGGGSLGNGDSLAPVFSADGSKVAFDSWASNLVPGDTNGMSDVFIKDLATGVATLVSSGIDGPGNGDSFGVFLSPDGRKVGFTSQASNLVAGDTNGEQDVFVKDLVTGAVTLVSSSASGLGNGISVGTTFSPDGSKVAFWSDASNLVAGGTNETFHVFVKDLNTGVVALISTAADGSLSKGFDAVPTFSPDGSKVAFFSDASNLVTGDTNGSGDVFVKDLTTGVVTLVSTGASGLGNNYSFGRAFFSPDGSKVAFSSLASNLVADDTNESEDVFIKDLTTGTVTLVSQAADGTIGNSMSWEPVFSPDGDKVAFTSSASNLLAGDAGDVNFVSLFIKDLVSGAVILIDRTDASIYNGFSYQLVAFSPDGSKLAFATISSNVVVGDANEYTDVFIKDLSTGFISASGTILVGNAGPDILVGTNLNDTLTGGAGDDVLRGNSGADRFVFTNGHGRDRVLDFRHTEGDVIALTGFGAALDSFAKSMAAAAQIDSDTVITTGSGSSITLVGISKAGLVAADFAFA